MNKFITEDIMNILELNCLKTFQGKTVMITGANGLIGSIMAMSLLEYSRRQLCAIKVVALVHSFEKSKKIFEDYINDKNFIIIEHDINEIIEYNGSVDYIIHAASITSSKLFVSKPVETIKTAINGSINLLEWAKTQKIDGIIYLSSLEVYGSFDVSEIQYIDENNYGYIDILKSRSSYSEGKRMVENIFFAYANEYDIPVKIARLTQTFGTGVKYDDSRVFAEFARCAIKGKNIVLHSKGETIRSYCYITDAIKAIIYILLYGEIGKAYNVSNDDTTISILDMAKLFCENSVYNIKVEISDDSNEMMGYNPVVKISLKNEELKKLGWKSEYNISAMVKRFMKYMDSIAE